ncbi:MAG: Hsp20/alpha crystallin family protein [Bacteroidetes bacterium]|nr:Hsp20/alpha crystallin family protein [Bacteroidota bacterium]
MTQTLTPQDTLVTVTPAVSIIESKDAYLVSLDIPGAAKDRIAVNVEQQSLHVTAEVPAAGEEAGKQYRRQFTLADDIDPHSADARYELGVLTVTLRKKEQYRPKQIHIQ